MSAIGYYFGRWITDSLKQPAGMIHLSIGGSPIETWIDAKQLSADSRFKNKTAPNWTENSALPVWIRQRAVENIGKSDPDGAHTFKPGYAFETMVKNLTALPIRGILFYQGESNAQEIERVDEYSELMKLMVNDYRKIWKDKNLPFYYVQLSSIDSIKYKSQYWPAFRTEQLKALKMIPHSGMAVSHDRGFLNDVHPTDKKTIAERLYKWAAHQLYGQKKTLPSGPIPVKAQVKKGYVMISFNYTGKKLGTSDGKEVRGCSLDGKTSAAATIKRNKLYVKTDASHGIVSYCYQPYCTANLVNEQGLPAPGFSVTFGSH
jgi:sialate O-acetylesterase